MAVLARFDGAAGPREVWRGAAAIAGALAPYGLGLGRWPERRLGPGDDPFALYADEIAALKARYGIQSMDRVVLAPGDVRWPALREQFVAEHTHADSEIRCFVGGSGLFHARVDGCFFGLLCEAGDWVSLPGGTPHGFDAGARADFDALRLFTRTEGWIATPTGAPRPGIPLFDEFVALLASRERATSQEHSA